MTLTGKAKEDFEKWYEENYWYYLFQEVVDQTIVNLNFKGLPQAMKYGVFVDWFDSVGIEVNIKKVNVLNRWMYLLKDMKRQGYHLNDYIKNKRCETRQEARTAAIEKANEIYNKRHE